MGKKHADLVHCTFSFYPNSKKFRLEVQLGLLSTVDCRLLTISLHFLPMLHYQIYILQ
jgi:hypothetical protein